MKTIGILCADSSDLYLAKAIYFIEQKLRANRYDSILCCTGYDLDAKISSMQLLLSKKVNAVILIGSHFVYETDAENQYITDAANQVPVMMLNAVLDHPNIYCVASDDFSSMYNATLAMIHFGIEDIVYFYNSTSYSGKQKLNGFCTAMEENELLKKEYLQFFDGFHEDLQAMARHLSHLRKQGVRFHGLIAADDALAVGAVKYAATNSLWIPSQLAVIGCNNSILAIGCEPELTSIDNKLEALCECLVPMLFSALAGQDAPHKTIIPGELIKRGTTPRSL